jgi:hypothetical protein
MTDAAWSTIVLGCWNTAIGAVVAITLKWMSGKAAKDAREAKAAALEVAKVVQVVKEDLKESGTATVEKLASIEATGEKVHTLVNSNLTNLLRLYAVSTRRTADLSGHADDETIARIADEAWKANKDSQPAPKRTAGNVFHGQK